MAPKGSRGTKRAAAGGVEKAAKKAASSKCATVAGQISKYEALPKSCRTMLASIADPILTTYATERHPLQVQALEMIAQTVAMIETDLEKCVSEAQAKVDNSVTEEAAHRSAVAAAETNLAASQEAATKAKENLQASTSGVEAAKADLASAQSALQGNEDALAGERTKKQSLENGKELYEELKASKQLAKDRRTSLKALTKVFTEFGLEEAVMNAVSEVLVKEELKRGTFDCIVLQQVDAKFLEWSASVESSIKACEGLLEELPKSVTAAEQHSSARAEELKASEAAFATATTAVSENKDAVKEATAALKVFQKGMPAAEGNLEKAKAALSSFKEGPSQAFAELTNLAPPELVPDPASDETAPALQETVTDVVPEETVPAVQEVAA